MQILIAANSKSGSGESSADPMQELKAEFSKYGITPDIYDLDDHTPEDINEFIKNGNYDVVAASGGDGTINMVAGLLHGKDIALGVIPAGTLNHFAKDLNIPLTIEDSVRLIASGEFTYVDTASVNGRLFLNNSSIGFYPLAVRKRDVQQSKFRRGKWLSMFYGLFSVFKRFPLYAVRVKTEKETLLFKTPIVFVGNNEYSTELFTIGSRESLSGGKLSLYFARSNTRFKVLKLVLSAFLNRLKESDELELKLVDEVVIESKKRSLSVSIDGEVEEMKPPLNYKIQRSNLKVITPQKS